MKLSSSLETTTAFLTSLFLLFLEGSCVTVADKFYCSGGRRHDFIRGDHFIVGILCSLQVADQSEGIINLFTLGP